jgi:hypothetical protein
MTVDEFRKLYEQWEAAALADKNDISASDDYYYHGAGSFRDYVLDFLQKGDTEKAS